MRPGWLGSCQRWKLRLITDGAKKCEKRRYLTKIHVQIFIKLCFQWITDRKHDIALFLMKSKIFTDIEG